MNRTLSFELKHSPAECEFLERGFLAVAVTPLVDGKPLYPSGAGDVFDAVSILMHGVETVPELDIFTCSCGVAGCAGIHDSCSLTVSETAVRWTFPEDPLRKRLDVSVFPPEEELALTFARPQYAQALVQLQADIESVRLAQGVAIAVAPCECPSEETLDTALPELLERYRTRVRAYREYSARLAAAEGELRDVEAVAELLDGSVWRATLSSIAWEALEALERDEAIEKLHAGYREELLADPLAVCQAFSAEQLQYLLTVDDECPVKNYDLDWNSVTLSTVRWSTRPRAV